MVSVVGRMGMAGLLPEHSLILFLMPILVSAYFGGTGPGLTTTAVIQGLTAYFLLPPYWHVGADDPRDWLALLLLGLLGVLISLLSGSLHRAVRAAEKAQAVQQRLLNDLALQERQRNTFLAMLSHELRNPLSPLKYAIHLLQRHPADVPMVSRSLGVMERQVARLTRLVDDLLDMTRLASDKFALALAPVDLTGLIGHTCEDYRPAFTAKGVALNADLPDSTVWLQADEQRIVQVISNLLANALKFTEVGGTVGLVLKCDLRANTAIVSVRDDGVGIAADVLPTLFEPFVQEARTTESNRHGLGLGLALANGIVSRHGGRLAAFSHGKHRGAEFVVTLPLAVPPPRPPSSMAPDRPMTPKRILVIGGDRDGVQTLQARLTGWGHQASVARTGEEGLRVALAQVPDVILCDIDAPGMDGLALASAVRAVASLDGTRLVAVSGVAQPGDVMQAIAAGFDQHITKPTSVESLQRLLTNV